MTIIDCIESQNYGEIKISILKDLGVIELLEADIKELMQFRKVSNETFIKLIKYIFLNDARIHAMILSHDLKEKHFAVGMTDLIYILQEVTGLSKSTLSKRIRICSELTTDIILCEIGLFKLVCPKFTKNEMQELKAKVQNAAFKIDNFRDDNDE